MCKASWLRQQMKGRGQGRPPARMNTPSCMRVVWSKGEQKGPWTLRYATLLFT